MVSVSPVLWGAAAFVVACGAIVAAAGIVVWHRVRRRLRALSSHAGVRSAAALVRLSHAGSGQDRRLVRLRYQLWQGVWSATRAVRGTERAGGAVADLPALCGRLRSSAEEVDRLLVLADGLPTGQRTQLEQQAAEMLEASRSIRSAALTSASDVTSARVASLVDDALREARALVAGVARSKEVRSPG